MISIGLPRIIWSPARAESTAASLSKVTKPKPRGRPVSLSIIRVASTTLPNWAKYSLKSVSLASWLTPPTKILLVRSCSSRGMARLGSILEDVSSGSGLGRESLEGALVEVEIRALTILPSSQCSLTITTLTVRGSLNVRNPNPRERPVAPSRITVHSCTSPNFEKYSLSDSSCKIRKTKATGMIW